MFSKAERFKEPENISPAVGTYDVSSGLLGTGHRFLKSDRWKEGMSPPPDTLIGSSDGLLNTSTVSTASRKSSVKVKVKQQPSPAGSETGSTESSGAQMKSSEPPNTIVIDLEKKVKQLIAERANLLKQVSNSQQELTKLDGRVQQLTKDKAELQSSLASSEREKRDLLRGKDVLQTKANTLGTRRSITEAQTQKEIESIQKDFQHTNVQLETSNKWYRSELSRVNDDKKRLQATISQLKTNLGGVTDEREQLKAEVEQTQSLVKSSQTKYTKLQSQHDESISKEKKKCDKIKKDKELLEERIQTLMALIVEKESEGKEQLEAIDCLKEDVEQCNEDMKLKENELVELRNRNEDEIKGLRSELDDITKALRTKVDEATVITKERDALTMEVSTLSDRLQESQLKETELTERVKEVEEEVTKNKEEIIEKELELKNLRESLEKEIEELKKIIQKLREQLRMEQERVAILITDKDALVIELEELKEKLKEKATTEKQQNKKMEEQEAIMVLQKEEISNKENELVSVKSVVDKQSKAATILEEKYQKERKRIEKLEMERDRAIKETKTTKEQVKERINKENIIEERMKVLQKDMKEKIKTIKERESEITEWKQKVDNVTDTKKTIDTLKEEIMTEQKKNRKVLKERELANKEVITLTTSLREKEKSERELDLKYKQVQQDLQLQQKQMKDKERSLKRSVVGDKETLHKDIENLQKEKQKLLKQNEELTGNMDTMRLTKDKEIKKLKHQVEEYNSKIKQLSENTAQQQSEEQLKPVQVASIQLTREQINSQSLEETDSQTGSGLIDSNSESGLIEGTRADTIVKLDIDSVKKMSLLERKIGRLQEDNDRITSAYDELKKKWQPFQDQIDGLEDVNGLLLSQTSLAKSEVERISEMYSKLLGHQNHKQKIQHVKKLKDENVTLKHEIAQLKTNVSKLNRTIKRLEEQPSNDSRKGLPLSTMN